MSTIRTLTIVSILILSLTGYGQQSSTMKQLAAKLHDGQICLDNNYKKLLADINSNKLENLFDFLRYCNRAVIIELKDYPNEPENYLEEIHKKTASIFPELSFTDFKFQIVVDSVNSDFSISYKAYQVIVSLKSNGKTYRLKSFISVEDIGKHAGMEYFGKIDQGVYYQIFNKILSDIQSPYRLHRIEASRGRVPDGNKFGIMALTKDQADILHNRRVSLEEMVSVMPFLPSYENFKNSLTSNKIETAIAEFQKLGLFSHLNSQQLSAAKGKVAQQENRTLNDVLHCFPNIIYTFDTESGNLQNPYKELLNELSLISTGAFKPVNITDSFAKPVNNKSLLIFSFNGKEYSKELKVEQDWIDAGFFDLVKQAVTEQKLSGQFYELHVGGQEASMIFLTAPQAEYLRTNKLLIFADQWRETEKN